MAIVVVEALLALVPPILFGRIIDDGIAEGDRQLVTALSLLIIGGLCRRGRSGLRRALVLGPRSARA